MAEDAPLPNQFFCPHCKRLLTSPVIVEGSKEKCPHCDLDFVVSSSMFAQESRNIAEEDEIYAIQIDATSAAPKPVLPSYLPSKTAAEIEEEEMLTWRPAQPPPRRLFLAKTFTAPFAPGFRGCFLMLLIVSLIMGGMKVQISYYLDIGIRGIGSGSLQYFNPWAFGFALSFLMVVIGVPLAFVLGAIALAIFRDTFEGHDRFISWPRDWFAHLIRDSSYVLISFFWGGLPIFIAVSLLPEAAQFKMPIIIVAELIVFPLFFLSALDNKSPVMFYSTPVWISLKYAWPAWKLFYLLTISAGAVFAVFLHIADFPSIWIKMVIIAVFLPFFFMIYFRLLARLAWYCSGRFDEVAYMTLNE